MAILKRAALGIGLFFTLGLSLCKASEQVAIDKFGYLNNNESPVIINAAAAQDLLNVDVTPGGKSIKKRSGYGSYKTVTGSQAMHGGHHFFDTSGNDVQVWGSSTSLFGIVADGTATQLVSSATLNATWDCADTQGNTYCANSSRNALIKTNGTTMTWYAAPLGTMVAVTPERLLVAGVAAAPNSIYYSAASDFTNFTVGINVPDSSIEQIAAPGSRLTHIEYACGRWLWWKDQSFGYVLGTDQTNLSIKIVSSVIGTQDNSSAIDPDGNVYFRSQEGHIYKYDCANITKLTTEITPTIQTSGRRTANLYQQTSQTDWQTGTVVPTGQLNTTILAGDVMPSSFTYTDDIAADWTAGTISSLTVVSGSLKLNYTGTSQMTNPGAESGSTAYTSQIGPTYTSGLASIADCSPTFLSPHTGSLVFVPGNDFHAQTTFGVEFVDMTGTVLASTSHTASTLKCSWTQGTVTPSASDYGKAVRVRMRTTGSYGTRYLTTVSSYTIGGNMTYWYANDTSNVNFDDFAGGLSSVTSGYYTSKTFDTGITNSYASITPVYTQSTFAPIFTLQDSANGTAWANVATSTATSYLVNRYIRYLSSFTPSATQDANTTLDSMVVVTRSSGTYYSPVVNRPNVTSWDQFNASYANNNGSHTFYLRASTNSYTVLSATPAWTAQTAGAVITIATGTYLQFRDDFGVTGSTHNPTLSDFTINWFEGTASDKAYATYFDNGIWWALAYGSGQSTNNYIFKFDLLNPGWTLYSIGVGGFLVQNNALYFGSPSTNAIYRFGNATSDNGSSINAYWQSKDFPGSDPWLENSYTQMDVIARRNASQTLTVGYTLNTSTTTSFTFSLSNTTDTTIRNKKLLPAGKIGGLLNIKFSDTSTTSAWEVLGVRVKYDPLAYRPTQ